MLKFSVAEKCPDLVNEWHPTKNGMLLPSDITIGSGKKVWWICSKGHEWEAVIANRAKGQRCPYCSGKRLIKGENDLQSKYPDIAKEWDYTKNAPLKPSDFMPNTNKTFWWKCSKGHEWEAKANNRVQGKGCPYCAGRRVIVGENDLLTKNPDLAAEWNYEKNYPLRPEDIMAGRNKSAWWKCKHCGFEWEAVINMRNRGAGCPKCARRFHSSFPEQALFFYIHQAYPDAINSYKAIFENNMELDIYIPSLMTGIEYDGEHAHSENRLNKDIRKYQACKSLGIKLIRIREIEYTGDIPICDIQINTHYTNASCNKLNNVIECLSKYITLNIDYDVDRDQTQIFEQIKSVQKARTLEEEYPELAKQWNKEKNGDLSPSMFLSGGGDRVWWKCKKGHEWKASIQPRTKIGVGCPYCSNKKVLSGYNDLATTDPSIAAEWNQEKNQELTPQNVTRSVSKKVFWLCPKGHSYQMRVDHRSSGHGCPYCAGRRAIPGENDFATLFPELIHEWNFELNTGISPNQFLPGSEKKVWWTCQKCGNTWNTIIANRTKGNGCPECGKKKASIRSLEAKMQKNGSLKDWCHSHPDKMYLLDEWDSSNGIQPDTVFPYSHKKASWTCRVCGHHWEQRIDERVMRVNTCSNCRNKHI